MKKKEKIFAMREPIHKSLWTPFEHIEHWLAKRGYGGIKIFCKWHKTLVEEGIEKIDLDTSDIKIISGKKL